MPVPDRCPCKESNVVPVSFTSPDETSGSVEARPLILSGMKAVYAPVLVPARLLVQEQPSLLCIILSFFSPGETLRALHFLRC